MSPNISSLVVI